ncbi:hypothetical protein PG989_014904 [Apiospora arundinis]
MSTTIPVRCLLLSSTLRENLSKNYHDVNPSKHEIRRTNHSLHPDDTTRRRRSAQLRVPAAFQSEFLVALMRSQFRPFGSNCNDDPVYFDRL